MVKSRSMKYFINYSSLNKCSILSDSQWGKNQKLLTKRNSNPNVFLFLVLKNLNRRANKKKETKCPLEEQKKNSKTVKSRSMKYFILLWTNVLFCRILSEEKQLLIKSNSKPNVFLFLLRKTWTDMQTKKKEMKCPLEEQKRTP